MIILKGKAFYYLNFPNFFEISTLDPQKEMLIYIFDSDLFLYAINLLNERLKPVFEYKITFWICVLLLWILKGYYVVKMLVWNVRIKAFWYTNIYLVCVKIKYCLLCLPSEQINYKIFSLLNGSQYIQLVKLLRLPINFVWFPISLDLLIFCVKLYGFFPGEPPPSIYTIFYIQYFLMGLLKDYRMKSPHF